MEATFNSSIHGMTEVKYNLAEKLSVIVVLDSYKCSHEYNFCEKAYIQWTSNTLRIRMTDRFNKVYKNYDTYYKKNSKTFESFLKPQMYIKLIKIPILN